MKNKFKKIIVITGYYGCGKTNLAVNIALYLRKYGTVSAVDLDIVNPYFRTADFSELFSEKGIHAYCPRYAGTNLDTPVLDFDMESIIEGTDYTIADVGGDDAGAYALGRYRPVFEKYSAETDIFYLFSKYRGEDHSPEEAAEIMYRIEKACGLKCTAIVNSSNLGIETTEETVRSSMDFQKELERITGLETAFVCVPYDTDKNNEFTVKRYVRAPWERNNI